MKCICENMKYSHSEMGGLSVYTTENYKGFILEECYGSWKLRFQENEGDLNYVDICYCPFCGRKLNNWDWSEEG